MKRFILCVLALTWAFPPFVERDYHGHLTTLTYNRIWVLCS